MHPTFLLNLELADRSLRRLTGFGGALHRSGRITQHVVSDNVRHHLLYSMSHE